MEESHKRITIFSLLAIVCSLIPPILFIDSVAAIIPFKIATWIKFCLVPIDLNSGIIGQILYTFFASDTIGYVFLGVLFTYGQLMNYKTKGRKINMLIYLFGAVFISKITTLLFGIGILILKGFDAKADFISVFISIASKFWWVYLSWYVLNFNKNKTIANISSEKNQFAVGSWVRFRNYIGDLVLITGMQWHFEDYFPSGYNLFFYGQKSTQFSVADGLLANLFFSCTFFLLYYLLFETLFIATPGKFLTGSKVLTANGETPDFKTILRRSLIRFIPFEPFSAFDKKPWHDTWSGTIVVKVLPPTTEEKIIREETDLEY